MENNRTSGSSPSADSCEECAGRHVVPVRTALMYPSVGWEDVLWPCPACRADSAPDWLIEQYVKSQAVSR